MEKVMFETAAVKISKAIIDGHKNARTLTEHQVCKLIRDHAMLDRRANETPEQAFARCFTA